MPCDSPRLSALSDVRRRRTGQRRCASSRCLVFSLMLSACSRGAADIPAKHPQAPPSNHDGPILPMPPLATINDDACQFGYEKTGDSARMPARDSEATFQTDRLHYNFEVTKWAVSGDIGYVFTNPTRGPVYFVNCRAFTTPALQKLVDGSWVTAWAPVVLTVKADLSSSNLDEHTKTPSTSSARVHQAIRLPSSRPIL